LKNTWLIRRLLTSERKQGKQKKSRRPILKREPIRPRLELLTQLSEIKISTMLELPRLLRTLSLDSKHQRTSCQEKTDPEVEEEAEEASTEEEEAEEELLKVVRENPEEVNNTLMSPMKNSPHYER
jgi:DNA-directed RNA polymerase specialized sigma subunit